MSLYQSKRRVVMKRLHLLTAVILALSCVSLHAETFMTANIPFDFQLGKQAMPAGAYHIKCSPGLLMLQSPQASSAIVVLTTLKFRDQAPETGLLEFNHYGDTYFFSAIWAPNSVDGATVPKTSREKELAKAARP